MLTGFLKGYPKVLLMGALTVGALVLLVWGLYAAEIVTLGIQREATQQSQPYVETKVRVLNDLYADYQRLEVRALETSNPDLIRAYRGQQAAVVNQMHTEASFIAADNVPSTVARFLATHSSGGF